MMKSKTILILMLIFWGCKSTQQSTYKTGSQFKAGTGAVETVLPAPVNTPDAFELQKNVYRDETYRVLQNTEEQFKEGAPFIELLDSGRRERLWFTSSRADELFYGNRKTNQYQQIYYCEREVGDGKSTAEGWGRVSLFHISTDNPFKEDFYRLFNGSTKGAIAIAGDKIIFSCDLIGESPIGDYKSLWEISRRGEVYGDPRPIPGLSNENTWESQPALSKNGKHLFFVSNRKIESDGITYRNDQTTNDMNLFYSFLENDEWRMPVPVTELNSSSFECSPFIDPVHSLLYFSSNQGGKFGVYQTALVLDDEHGGYRIEKDGVVKFSRKLINLNLDTPHEVTLDEHHNHWYPFVYFNPLNRKSPRALFWSSDHSQGYGNFDIHACDMPFEVELRAVLADLYPVEGMKEIVQPVLTLRGYNHVDVTDHKAVFHLYSGLDYRLFGGSMANPNNGTYSCDLDRSFIFTGYSQILNNDPLNKAIHKVILKGTEVESKLTGLHGKIPFGGVLSDTIMNDTVFITKAWEQKPPCPGKLNIEPVHRSIAYFQTGFWEVNTTGNLKRDLAALHDGYEVFPDNDLYNPADKILVHRSDYKAFQWESPLSPIRPGDGFSYSIADARWIELHPNNLYWGDRPGFDASRAQRMKGRKERIAQYLEYARKVDENLKNLTDTIRYTYIDLLEKHKEQKPRLLIEIFAVSDQREVLRGWYIGDTVKYRGSEYSERKREFITEQVRIIPPKVNEQTKTIEVIKPCTLELNADGDNGSFLGINQEKTVLNTNLSRLRAWFGYREVLKQLRGDAAFEALLKQGSVALPDNEVPYDQADIIIITRGKREDGDVQNPKQPYPAANNPSGNGFFDYDRIRRIEIQARLLFENEQRVVENYCCDPNDVVFK